MATGPRGNADERLADLGYSLRELQGKIEALRRTVAGLDPGSIPTPTPPEPPPEGDELVARLQGLLDELREITESAMRRSEPAARRSGPPGASAAARRSRR
jgi:hypothetical protein